MSVDKLQSSVSDLLFYGAFALLAVALVERGLVSWLQMSLIAQVYGPWRLTQFSAVLMLFAGVIFLREIRDLLRQRSA